MSYAAQDLAWPLTGLSCPAKCVLMNLSYHANSETGKCTPSYELIARECCASRRTVMRAMKELAKKGFVIKRKRFLHDRRMTSNWYELKHFKAEVECQPVTPEAQTVVPN